MKTEEFIRRSAVVSGNAQAYSFSEMMEQRASQPYPIRLAKVCFGKAMRQLLARSLDVNSESYHLLSAGGQQLVYATDTKVAKIVFQSLAYDKERVEADVNRHQSNYDQAQPHLGDHLVDTDFDIKRLRGGLFAAVALQPRIAAEREFTDVNDMVTYRDDPTYINQLQSLFEHLTDLYKNTGLQMDLNGPRNIFLETANAHLGLRIVDTIVVTPELQAVVDPTRHVSTGRTLAEKLNIIEEVVRKQPVVV